MDANQLDERYRAIAERWVTKSESGVTIHPLRASVQAIENLGLDATEARGLLALAEEQYAAKQLDDLLVSMARINRCMAEGLATLCKDEPATWAEYAGRLESIPTADGRPMDWSTYRDRVHGAWLGKCIGTAVGDPVEGWTREAIKARHGWVDRYLVPPKTENDDTAYPILVLHVLDEHGASFRSEDLGLEWVAHLPFAYTAEQAALDSLKGGVLPPNSRWQSNPCGAWVGGQMRGEVHGLIAPLQPALAAAFAFRDAVISHYREGLEGACYAAALVSLAFGERDVETLLHRGLAVVPASSRIRATVEQSIAWCQRYGAWEPVAEAIEREMCRYHWIHTLPNLACVVCGLMLGEGEFERSILTTLACGLDTDCTAGQVGALMGTVLGVRGIPEKWRKPIGDTLDTYVIGFERMPIEELVRWTVAWGDRLSGRDAGSDSVTCGG